MSRGSDVRADNFSEATSIASSQEWGEGPSLYPDAEFLTFSCESFTGVWFDSDEDGIPDVVEGWFVQADWPLSRSELLSSLQENLTSANAENLYTGCSWYVEYGADLADEGKNATKWAQTTFNPFVPDTGPPVLAHFEVHNVAVWDWVWVGLTPIYMVVDCYADITYEFRDPSGVNRVRFIKLGAWQNSETDYFSGERVASGTARLTIDYWLDYMVDYDINITARDARENVLYGVENVNGVFGGLIDVIREMWAIFTASLGRAWKAITDAVNFIIKWLMEVVNNTLNTVLEPVISAYNRWQTDLVNTINKGWEEYNATGTISDETIDRYNSIIGGTFFYLLLAVSIAIIAISIIITIYTAGTFSLISSLIAPIITLAILGIVKLTETKEMPLDLSYVDLTPESIINKVVELITGNKPTSNNKKYDIRSEDFPTRELIAIVLKYISVFAEWFYIIKHDVSGMSAKSLGFVFGAFSVLFACIGLTTNSDLLSALAIFLGLCGIICVVKAWFTKRAVPLIEVITTSLGSTGVCLAAVVFDWSKIIGRR